MKTASMTRVFEVWRVKYLNEEKILTVLLNK